MAKWRNPPNIRTIVEDRPGFFEKVSDEWPPTSRSRRYQLTSGVRVHTRVVEGIVYVSEDGIYSYYRAGQAFMQRSGITFFVGSVRGARTISCGHPSVTRSTRFLPEPDKDECW